MDVHNYKLTPRGLKILKMDTLRLNDYLNQVMLENPVIEIEENLTGYTDEDLRARKAEWLESNDFEEGLSYFDKETELPQAEEPVMQCSMPKTVKLWNSSACSDCRASPLRAGSQRRFLSDRLSG